jgi:hypothetical protein
MLENLRGGRWLVWLALIMYIAMVGACIGRDEGHLYTVSRCIDGRLLMQVGFTFVILVHGASIMVVDRQIRVLVVVYLIATLSCTYISLSRYMAIHYVAVGVAASGVLIDATLCRSYALPVLLLVALAALVATGWVPAAVAPLEHVYFITAIVRVELDAAKPALSDEPPLLKEDA